MNEDYFSGGLENLVNNEETRDFLEKQTEIYFQMAKYEGHTGPSLKWIKNALETAKEGSTWDYVETNLNIAKTELGYKGKISDNLMEKINTIYHYGLAINGHKQTHYWLNKIYQTAKNENENWESVETKIRITEQFAKESNQPITLDIEEIKKIYDEKIKTYYPEK
jgi:hypothetical protein